MDRDGTRANATAARENASEGVEEVTPGKRGAGWRVAEDPDRTVEKGNTRISRRRQREDWLRGSESGGDSEGGDRRRKQRRGQGHILRRKATRQGSQEAADAEGVHAQDVYQAGDAEAGTEGKRARCMGELTRGGGEQRCTRAGCKLKRRVCTEYGRQLVGARQRVAVLESELDELKTDLETKVQQGAMAVRAREAELEGKLEELRAREQERVEGERLKEVELMRTELEEEKREAEEERRTLRRSRLWQMWAEGQTEEGPRAIQVFDYEGWLREGLERQVGGQGSRFYTDEGRVALSRAVEACRELEYGLAGQVVEWQEAVGSWRGLMMDVERLEQEKQQVENRLGEVLENEEELVGKIREQQGARMQFELQQLERREQELQQERMQWSEERIKKRKELKEGWAQLVEQQQKVRNRGAEAKQRRMLWVQGRLGAAEQRVLDIVAEADEGLRRVEIGEGMRLYNYKSGDGLKEVADRHKCDTEEGMRLMTLLGECRGLVLRGEEVVSRPVQRFFRVKELQHWGRLVTPCKVVTEKLDGEMLCGVVLDGRVELWSRAGWTELGKAATRVASQQEGLVELVGEVWRQGASATFEYIGKQSWIKVRYARTQLVLVAVRDRQSGDWWQWEQLEQLAERHGVQLVRRFRELEGKSVQGVQDVVKQWKQREGVVVWLEGGAVCKVKSDWWLKGKALGSYRWYRPREWEKEQMRQVKKKAYMETKEQRVVLRGWDHSVSPAKALRVFESANKVEALYGRQDGKQGTLILSFQDPGLAAGVRGEVQVGGMTVWAEQAYSARTKSDGYNKVRTWWRHSGDAEGGERVVESESLESLVSLACKCQ